MFDDAREMNLPETDKTNVLTKKDEAKKDEVEDKNYSWPLSKASVEKAGDWVAGHWKLCLIAACGFTWYYQKRGKR